MQVQLQECAADALKQESSPGDHCFLVESALSQEVHTAISLTLLVHCALTFLPGQRVPAIFLPAKPEAELGVTTLLVTLKQVFEAFHRTIGMQLLSKLLTSNSHQEGQLSSRTPQ